MTKNLHRWNVFKNQYEVDTITQQANADHCGGCGFTPLAPKNLPPIPMSQRDKQSITKSLSRETFFPRHFRRHFLLGSIILASGMAITTNLKKDKPVQSSLTIIPISYTCMNSPGIVEWIETR